MALRGTTLSSSYQRPIEAEQWIGLVRIAGIPAGPIRLPDDARQRFVDQFNETYNTHLTEVTILRAQNKPQS